VGERCRRTTARVGFITEVHGFNKTVVQSKDMQDLAVRKNVPRQKQPQISPIFISDKVTLHVSPEKDKELHWSTPDGTIRRSFTRTVAGKLAGRRSVAPTPRQGGAMTPLRKLGPPLRPPWFFTSYRCRSRASNGHFSPSLF
jgi:hypothetical protein